MRFWFAFAVVVAIFSVPVVAIGKSGEPQILPRKWESKHYANNPLVGKLYSGHGEEAKSRDLVGRLGDVQYLLLGEIHDNPDHHLIQMFLLTAFGFEKGKSVPIVFEMVPQRLQPVFDEIAAQNQDEYLREDELLNKLAQKLEWEKRGWYSWDIYRPIFLAAVDLGMPLKAGNLDRQKIRTISKQGFDALTKDERERFGLDHPLPGRLQKKLAAELRDSHCGMLPETAIPAMINVQRAKDGSMADVLIQVNKGLGGVLSAGDGHVRNDYGVPYVLKKLQPKAKTLSVGLIEVSPDALTFADYNLENEQGEPLYDYVIFTPKFDITDHCAAMRAQFKSKKPDGKKE